MPPTSSAGTGARAFNLAASDFIFSRTHATNIHEKSSPASTAIRKGVVAGLEGGALLLVDDSNDAPNPDQGEFGALDSTGRADYLVEFEGGDDVAVGELRGIAVVAVSCGGESRPRKQG